MNRLLKAFLQALTTTASGVVILILIVVIISLLVTLSMWLFGNPLPGIIVLFILAFLTKSYYDSN